VSRSLRTLLASVTAAALLAGCGGGGGGGTRSLPPNPTAEPTSSPTTAPTSPPVSTQAAYTCPTSDTVASVARTATAMVRVKGHGHKRPVSTPTMLAVTYASSATARGDQALMRQETVAGAHFLRSMTFSHIGKVMHLVAVPSGAKLATVEAALRRQPGVLSVEPAGAHRAKSAITTPYWTNDPYFVGFTSAQNTQAGNSGAAATYKQLPLVENPSVPGQWNMHVMGLEHAFAYSQSGNGSAVPPNAGALGSSSVKLAIIDTGSDPHHPELSSKITYQKCYITAQDGSTQSTSNFETDPDGHGTDVAGLAGAATNNGLGYAAAGGNVSIYAYRIYPTPADDCNDENTNDLQCEASTGDIASSIEDAISHGVNVISMSLGGDQCSSGGQDSDATEGAAIADAIAAHVVVVAAAGNAYGPPLEAPACDSGVIAAGASALADGQPNASGVSGGTPSSPKEYVATYTDYGSPGAALHSASAWGILAPGGDANGTNDDDLLHWIQDIWTTTPVDSSFAGSCSSDYPFTGGTPDCSILIDGTSMATPEVAGAAALIISATGGSGSPYQSSSAMKSLLCETADDIGDPNQGCGRLNVYRAMAKALGDPNLP